MKKSIASVFRLYKEAIDDEISDSDRKHEAEGCIDIIQMCSLVKAPQETPLAIQTHIAGCSRCRTLYKEFLETYPDLTHPAWLPEAEDSHASSALVKRQTTALAKKEDVAERDFRPWYLDHEGNDMRPWYMRPFNDLKHILGDVFRRDQRRGDE